jgi:hypothetical protein
LQREIARRKIAYMRHRIVRSFLGLILAALLPAPWVAAEPEVHVYTNADLQRFELPGETGEPDPQPVETWGYVVDYLEREWARIDADRSHDLERARVRNDEMLRDRSTISIPYAPFYYGFRVHDRYRGNRPEQFDGDRLRGISAFRQPGHRPLHAGPTHTQIHRARALRHKGVDAFPSR